MDVDSEFSYDDDSDTLDPRIKEELDNLNTCSDTINKLGNELQAAREKFEMNKRKAKHAVTKMYKSMGRRNVQMAKKYYITLQDIEKLKSNLHKSTINYHNIQTHCELSKKKVVQLEKLLSQHGNKLDVVLLDELNNANIQLTKGKVEMSKEDEEHSKMTGRLFVLERQLTEEPFFQLKKELEKKLKAERQNAEDLHLALICHQQKYKMTLMTLENISNEEHMRRQLMSTMLMGIRTPDISSQLSTDDDNEDYPDDNDSAFSDYDLQKTITNLVREQEILQSDSASLIETSSLSRVTNVKIGAADIDLSLALSTTSTITNTLPSTIATSSILITSTAATTTTDAATTAAATAAADALPMVREDIDGAEDHLTHEHLNYPNNNNYNNYSFNRYENSFNNGRGDISNKFALIKLSNYTSNNKAKHFSISISDSSSAALMNQQQLTLLSPMMLQVTNNNSKNSSNNSGNNTEPERYRIRLGNIEIACQLNFLFNVSFSIRADIKDVDYVTHFVCIFFHIIYFILDH
ncbi:hypothetical protein HELRODRAFT_166174 [Helobdella robusta]|uniref:Uncharacterized protein n=1 Tax=Helobdella robusta TaxID=6412 RepID=T1EXV3_HELRO|nr:hypothetical protein HELRODRAFT_166174 [Helobdella robusta]ESN90502.1 hypothetical protein HELRODRAFT_166174 [Helobdella robusta]